MPYIIKGIDPQTKKNAGLRACVMGGLVKPKKVRKPRATGYKCNREEDRIRPLIIKALRKHGYKVWRVEPSFRGKFGLGDLWVMHPRGVAAWVEVKTPTGILSKDQMDFQELCLKCRVHHLVVRSVQYTLDIMRLL